MKLDLGKLGNAPRKVRAEGYLMAIALAIAPAILRHDNLWIDLPLIGIIAIIVVSLVFGLFRGPRR
jgi:hypothetical protein